MNKRITCASVNNTKIYFLGIIFFFSLFVNAQTKIILKGKLIDKETSAPIEEATVYLTSVKDSTVIDYTILDKNEIFKIETKKITVPFFLKVSATGYENHSNKENSGSENKDFGTLPLLKKEVMFSITYKFKKFGKKLEEVKADTKT